MNKSKGCYLNHQAAWEQEGTKEGSHSVRYGAVMLVLQ